MANFCAKCGAALSPDQQSCTACGAPVAPFTPVSFQPVAPMATARPVAPPPSYGTSAVKIILIIVAIFVGLGIIGVGAFGFMAWRIARSVHVSGPNGEVSVSTPGGTITANPNERYSASDLGTDTYPGATAGKGGAKMTLPGGSWISAVYVTPDSKDQVVSFYKSRLGSELSVYDSADSAVLTAQKSKQEAVIVTVTANKSEYQGKTQITIVHTISTKAN